MFVAKTGYEGVRWFELAQKKVQQISWTAERMLMKFPVSLIWFEYRFNPLSAIKHVL
jgi:hypothetical protein